MPPFLRVLRRHSGPQKRNKKPPRSFETLVSNQQAAGHLVDGVNWRRPRHNRLRVVSDEARPPLKDVLPMVQSVQSLMVRFRRSMRCDFYGCFIEIYVMVSFGSIWAVVLIRSIRFVVSICYFWYLCMKFVVAKM